MARTVPSMWLTKAVLSALDAACDKPIALEVQFGKVNTGNTPLGTQQYLVRLVGVLRLVQRPDRTPHLRLPSIHPGVLNYPTLSDDDRAGINEFLDLTVHAQYEVRVAAPCPVGSDDRSPKARL